MRSAKVAVSIIFAISIIAVGGCATSGNNNSWNSANPESTQVQLEVENQNFYDANLWAANQYMGNQQRIGFITGHTKETFTFSWPYQDLRIVTDFVAAGSNFSCTVPVISGDIVVLVIEPNAHRSEPLCNWR